MLPAPHPLVLGSNGVGPRLVLSRVETATTTFTVESPAYKTKQHSFLSERRYRKARSLFSQGTCVRFVVSVFSCQGCCADVRRACPRSETGAHCCLRGISAASFSSPSRPGLVSGGACCPDPLARQAGIRRGSDRACLGGRRRCLPIEQTSESTVPGRGYVCVELHFGKELSHF